LYFYLSRYSNDIPLHKPVQDIFGSSLSLTSLSHLSLSLFLSPSLSPPLSVFTHHLITSGCLAVSRTVCVCTYACIWSLSQQLPELCSVVCVCVCVSVCVRSE